VNALQKLGGPLVRLSFQRVDGARDVQAPDNETRLRAFRPFMPVQFGNAHFALSEGERYAANEAADGREYTTDVHYLETTK
jgi:hypothetical protein